MCLVAGVALPVVIQYSQVFAIVLAALALNLLLQLCTRRGALHNSNRQRFFDMNKQDLLVSVSDLNKSYQDGERIVTVLEGVDLQLQAGEMLAIIGASGSGKSTLLHILGGIDKADSGQVTIAVSSHCNYHNINWHSGAISMWVLFISFTIY